ncbi:MAG: hydrogenase maturation protease [Planctomycetota bacterium]
MESPDYYTKDTLVLGCGNILYGDDGFGPDVADYILSNYKIPENAAVVNLGLSTRGFIFDILLNEKRPKIIIVVDAVTCEGKEPGEIFEMPLDNLCREKVDDFSFHQGPTSNLLKELRDICGVEIVIIACQPTEIPREMTRGLSEPLKKAVDKVSKMIYDKYLNAPQVSLRGVIATKQSV